MPEVLHHRLDVKRRPDPHAPCVTPEASQLLLQAKNSQSLHDLPPATIQLFRTENSALPCSISEAEIVLNTPV